MTSISQDSAQNVAYVFICFSSTDEAAARQVVARLEAEGLHCWISLRDVAPGHNYQESIITALEGAKGVVFLFSENSSASGETKKELSVAGSLNMTVIPLRLTPIIPTGALRYELATRQWVDLFPDQEDGFRKVIAAVRRVLDPEFAGEANRRESRPPDHAANFPSATSSPANPLSQPARAPVLPPGTQEFEAVRALLARYIGPIAKVYVTRAVTEAHTIDELCTQLAAHVDSPSDRATFLKEARARLASKA